MEQNVKPENMTPGQFNRMNMSPTNYFEWRIGNLSSDEQRVIIGRKREVVDEITKAVLGPAHVTNDMISDIVDGNATPEKIEDWIKIARDEKERRKTEMGQKPIHEQASRNVMTGSFVSHLSEALDAKENQEE